MVEKKIEATDDFFTVTLTIPRKLTGRYTLDLMAGIEDGDTWEEDAVCVWINNAWDEYALHHTQYLDYKGSLQATNPIFHFDSQKEALDFAHKYGLMVEYSSRHNFMANESNQDD